MHLWEADAWATTIRERAGVDADEVVKPSELARGLGVELYQARGLRLPGDAALAFWGGKPRIALRSGLSVERARFAVFHELAEYALAGHVDATIEDACNAIAAALAMPRRAFLRAIRDLGEDPHALAHAFRVTPTAAALRLGETTQIPLAALTPSWMWIRGRAITWPPEPEIRRIARGGRPGIRKLGLEPRRVALIVEELDEAI